MLMPSFNSGELSPKIRGRVDTKKYYNGAQVLENMIPKPSGLVKKRPGTYYISDANDTVNIRLLPFNVSNSTSYILELGHEYIRFYEEQ